MKQTPTFSLHLTPFFIELTPGFMALVTRSVPAGISGPFSDTVAFATVEEAVAWALDIVPGTTVGEWSPVCANGFATATLS